MQFKIIIPVLILFLWQCANSELEGNGGGNNNNGSGDLTIEELFTQTFYNTITKKSAITACQESNFSALGIQSGPNKNWYYTYDHFLKAMKMIPEFAQQGDNNTRKLEIAAFFAHVNQETGEWPAQDTNGVGCFIQEGAGAYYGSSAYTSGIGSAAAGYFGRGPHQLSWDYNYKAFQEDVPAVGDILDNPDILTTNPVIGIAGSLWFWMHEDRSGNGTSLFKPSAHNVMIHQWTPTAQDVAANRTLENDFGVTTNIINGGMECKGGSNPQGAANRVRNYLAYAQLLNATISNESADLDCSEQDNFAARPSR